MKSPPELSIRTIAMRMQLVDEKTMGQVLRKRKKLAAQGKPIRLSDLLVKLDLADEETMDEILQMKKEGYYFCEACPHVQTLSSIPMGRPPHCDECLTPLRRIGHSATAIEGSSAETQAMDPVTEAEMAHLFPDLPPTSRQRYPTLDTLGKGGFGAVYQIQDPVSGRTMALKTLLPEKAENPAVKKRFLREIQITSILEHPNIMPVYDSGYFADGTIYFVMKEVKGGTMSELIKAEERRKFSRQPLGELLDMYLKVCDAVQYAHSKGVIHRDLKPSNIVVGDFGEVMVMDWGIAKSMGMDEPDDWEGSSEFCLDSELLAELGQETLTHQGAMMGTVGYMAPEQANGTGVDHRCDIFSLGAILYEILAFTPAFSGNPQEKLIATLMKEPLPPEVRRPQRNIPRELSAVAMKALARDPEERYQDIMELKEDILRYREGFGVSAQKDSPLQSALRLVKRNRAAAIVVAVLLFTIIGGTWFTYHLEREKKREEQLERNERKENFLQRARNMMEIAVLAEDFQTLAQQDKSRSTLSADLQKRISEELGKYTQARFYLNQALALAPQDQEVKQTLFKVEREIGLLALLVKNYILARMAFERCSSLGFVQGKALLDQMAREKDRETGRQLEQVKSIMSRLAKASAPLGMMDEFATEILRMKSGQILTLLVKYLRHGNTWQRRLAIQSLGKLGNRHHVVEKKDVGEWLVQRLKDLNRNQALLSRHQKEVEDLIWALGRLRDSRSNQLVDSIRWSFGQSSRFWKNTQIPYHWIPLVSDKKLTSAEDYNERGLMKKQKGNLKGALKDFNQAIKLDSRSLTAYINRGVVHSALKLHEKALKDFTKALDLNPQLTRAQQNRALTYIRMGKWKQALDDFDQVVVFEPNNHSAYSSRGYVKYMLKDLDGAIADFTESIRQHRINSYAYFWRAMVKKDKNDLDGAIADYTTAIQYDPKDPTAFHNRALARAENGDINGAISDYSESIRLDPKAINAYRNRAELYKAKKDYGRAQADYTTAVKLDPKNANLYFYRAIVKVLNKDMKGAKEDFTASIKIEPHAGTYNNRGLAKETLKDEEGALEDFTEAIKLDPKFLPAYRNRAKLHKKRKAYGKALSDYNRMADIAPHKYQVFNERGRLQLLRGNTVVALKDHNRAIDINPKIAKSYYYRGSVYHQRKKWDKALEDFTKALSLDEGYAPAYYGRGLVYLQKKNHSLAAADFRRYLKLFPSSPFADRIRKYLQQFGQE